MKKLLLIVVLSISTSVYAGQYSSCWTHAYEGGRLSFNNKHISDGGKYPAEIDNSSVVGIHGTVIINRDSNTPSDEITDLSTNESTVTFTSRNFFGDVYQDIEFTLPIKTFHCTTKYY
jgi:hypothetical protein